MDCEMFIRYLEEDFFNIQFTETTKWYYRFLVKIYNTTQIWDF